MRTKAAVSVFLCALVGMRVAQADPLSLFTNIVYSADGSSPPPEDSLAIYESTLNITNLIPGTAAFRTRPNLIFASGFDEQNACPGVVY